MEIPYRGSTADSDGRSSIVNPAINTPTVVGTTNSSLPASPTKVTSVASAVTSLLNRNRQRSQRRPDSEESKWSIRRRRSTTKEVEPEEVPLNNNNNNNNSSENPNDCRVTVV